MEKEVHRELWLGQIPVCFKLHEDDIKERHRPDPYYLMVSRVTYFPLVLDRVVKYFNRFVDQSLQSSSDMWLDYEGQFIKCHYPVGLSWDLFGSNYDLPWRLTLHFSDFPSKELVRCNIKSTMKSNFMSAIKEADALKHKGAVIQNMVEKDNNKLWSSLVMNKYEQFWSVNQRLMEKTDNELFRYIPFRLYLTDYTYIQKVIRPCTTEPHIFKNTEKLPASHDNSPNLFPTMHDYDKDVMMNKPHKCSHTIPSENEISETKANHRYSTVLDLIQISFVNRMDDLLMSKDKAALVESSSPSLEEHSTSNLIDVKLFKYRFISHGVEIPFDAPLQWLSENFSYPDNFLHICSVRKEQ